jgi:membrane protein implicated in regulation of membrane protease activity
MTDRKDDHTTRPPDERASAGQVGAALTDAAHAARPRAAFVTELEAHLRRQPPIRPARARHRWGGFRVLVLAAIVALGLGALAFGAGALRPAATLGTAPPTSTAALPTTTATTGKQTLPAGASTAVSLGAVAGLGAWVPAWLADPTVVYLLLTLGALAVLLEALHPGAFVPGMVGGVALLLGVIGLLTLPLNWAGLLLLLVALALVVTDIQASTHGALTLAALVAFVPGSLILFNASGQARDAVALPAVLGLAALLGAFGLGVGALAAHTHTLPSYRYALPEGGDSATTIGPLAPTGVVQVGGQLWSARADIAPIPADQPVRVLEREGLTLVVQPLAPGVAGESEFPDVDR